MKVLVRRKPDRDTLQLYYVDPLTGRDRTKSARTNNWRMAERAAAAWEQQLAQHGVVDSDPTWSALRAEYERVVGAGQSAGSQESGDTAFGAFEKLIPESTRVSRITSLGIEQCAAQWRREGKRPATIDLYLSRVRTVLRWAHAHDLLASVPRFPKRPRIQPRGRPLTDAEYRHLLRTCRRIHPHDWRQWVRFLRGIWVTGLRIMEAQTVSWDAGPLQVDLDGGKYPCLSFLAKGQKAHRKERTPLTPAAAHWLARLPLQDRSGRVFPLLKPNGTDFSPKAVDKAMHTLGVASGIVVDEEQGKFVSAHDLRRSFGTRWSYKVKPLTLQKMMRHASLETTLRYYVAQDVDKVAEELWA